MTKAVFLFGSPNKGKWELLEKIQLYYTDLVNKDIEILSNQPALTMKLVKNDQLCASGEIRKEIIYAVKRLVRVKKKKEEE